MTTRRAAAVSARVETIDIRTEDGWSLRADVHAPEGAMVGAVVLARRPGGVLAEPDPDTAHLDLDSDLDPDLDDDAGAGAEAGPDAGADADAGSEAGADADADVTVGEVTR